MMPKDIPGVLEIILAEHTVMRQQLEKAGVVMHSDPTKPVRWQNGGELMIPLPPEPLPTPPAPLPLSQGDSVGLHVRGKHAAHDNVIPVKDDSGKTKYINNLSTRIDSSTTAVFMSACQGTVCLRLDDEKHPDFWVEFNVDVPMLERLLAEAKKSLDDSSE